MKAFVHTTTNIFWRLKFSYLPFIKASVHTPTNMLLFCRLKFYNEHICLQIKIPAWRHWFSTYAYALVLLWKKKENNERKIPTGQNYREIILAEKFLVFRASGLTTTIFWLRTVSSSRYYIRLWYCLSNLSLIWSVGNFPFVIFFHFWIVPWLLR